MAKRKNFEDVEAAPENVDEGREGVEELEAVVEEDTAVDLVEEETAVDLVEEPGERFSQSGKYKVVARADVYDIYDNLGVLQIVGVPKEFVDQYLND